MSIRSTKNGSIPIFYYSKVGASSLNVVNQSLDTIYEFPKVAPTENGQVIAVNTDGSSSFVDNAPANPNALITDTPLITPETNSVIVSDGLNPFGTLSFNTLKVSDIAVDCYTNLNVNQAINIQSDISLPTSMAMVAPENNFVINNGQSSQTIFSGSSAYIFDNNVISNENIILNQSKTLTLNNDIDVDNIKIYKELGLNGNFILDNQTGSILR